jgi:hypothetical protein
MMHDESKLVAAAAAANQVEVDALLAFKVYTDKVVIVLPSGRKLSYGFADLTGWLNDDPPVKATTTKRKRSNTRK